MQISDIVMPAASVPAPSKTATTRSAHETDKFGDKLTKAMANNAPDKGEPETDKVENAADEANALLAGTAVVVAPVPVMIQAVVIACQVPQQTGEAQATATNLMNVPQQAIVVAQSNLADADLAGTEKATANVSTQSGMPVVKAEVNAETPKVETASVNQPAATQTNTPRMEAESAAAKPVIVETQPAHVEVETEEAAETKVDFPTNQEAVNAYAKAIKPEEPMLTGKKGPVLSQVAEGIKEMVQNGHTTVRLQIEPENLGRISMKLTSGAEGMHVSFTADKPATQRLLENSLDHLRVTLQNAGVQLGGLSVGNQSTNADQRGVFDTPKGTYLTTSAVEDTQEAQTRPSLNLLHDSLLGLNYAI